MTIRRWCRIFVLAGVLLLGAAALLQGRAQNGAAPGTSYYVDAIEGNDAADGRAAGSAWKSLDRVNKMEVFQPGDRILFKAGCSWTGQLRPRGSGTRRQAITIDSYGNGGKPRIDGGAGNPDTLYLGNQSFWDISNLELTNQNPAKRNDRTRRGVYVEARGRLVEGIRLRNLVIHDIRGLVAVDADYNRGKDSAGIGFEVTDRANGARFDDLLVEGCDLYAIDSTGIFTKGTGSVYPRSAGWDEIKFTNIILQNNRIHDIAKNAVIVRQLDGGIIQKNTVWDTAFRARSGNQIFTRTCYGTVVQFNECYLNRATEDMDGSAFDADLESPATVWQYNYSHDNKFGLITFCTTAPDRDIVVRYNISRNDQGRIFNINYNFTSAGIYNNTVYIPAHLSPQILWETNARTGENFSGSQSYFFNNNLVYNLSPTATYNLNSNHNTQRHTTRTLRNNCFFGHQPAGGPQAIPAGPYHTYSDNITGDPMLVDPGSGAIGMDTLPGYRLRSASCCIRAGISIPGNGGRDFWGNPLPDGNPDIGAHQFSGNRMPDLKWWLLSILRAGSLWDELGSGM
jgi:hypothetical protein